MSRLTPFEFAFGKRFEDHFTRLRREELASGKDVRDRAQFAALPSVRQILTEIESPELLSNDPTATGEYLTLLYAAFRFWSAGQMTYRIAREAIDDSDVAATCGASLPRIPQGACYLQFPERWFWAQIDRDAPHEPLDGMFVADSADGRELTVVAVLGLRVGREGFSQISVCATPEDMTAAAGTVRAPPFAPLMDGGSAADFKSLASTGELLYLARLALTQIAR